MNQYSGQSLGRYQIVEQLGEGGMATVYKAYDTRLDREVAIKVIRTEKGVDDSFLKRFEREAKALAKLSHPNIVHVNDYGDQNGVPYVVMDYLSGGTLKKKMGVPIHFREAARLLLPIAHALEFAHEMHIIHRDVKPANILLTQNDIPMLSDFGIAKILEEQTSELTGTGVGIGTPEYMAPEQGSGKKVDYRADIYALGVVFYEMVTGRKPFRADTPMAVIIKAMTEPLPRPGDLVKDLPGFVEQVIYKALAKDPDNRYQNMQEFADALEKISTGQKASIDNQHSTGAKKVTKKTAIIGGLSVAMVLAGLIGVLILCVLVWYLGPWKKPAGEQPTDTPAAALTPQKTSSLTSGQNSGQQMDFITQMKQGKITQGQKVDLGDISVPVGSKIVSFTSAITKSESNVNLIITDPDGKIVDTKYDGALFNNLSKTMVTSISSPKPGKWKVTIVGQKISGGDEQYTCVFQAENPQLPSGVLFEKTDSLTKDGGVGYEPFTVMENTASIEISVFWENMNAIIKIGVTDPDGVYLTENDFKDGPYAKTAQFSSSAGFYIVTINKPKAGKWKVHLEGSEINQKIDFSVQVKVKN